VDAASVRGDGGLPSDGLALVKRIDLSGASKSVSRIGIPERADASS